SRSPRPRSCCGRGRPGNGLPLHGDTGRRGHPGRPPSREPRRSGRRRTAPVIPLAFIVGVALFLGAAALVPDRLSRPLRLLIIVAAPLTAVAVWEAVHAFQGWPLATTAPPLGAAFVAADVHEPDWIYLWLEPRESSRPRAYRVRYSDHLYAQVLKAQH